MISREYVSGNSSMMDVDCNRFSAFLEKAGRDIDAIVGAVAMESYRDSFLGDLMLEAKPNAQPAQQAASAKKGFFARIGEKVVEMYEKFCAFMDRLITNIKSIGFSKKSDVQKLEILIRQHPELKDRAIAAVDSGALELKDISNLKELNAAFDEIMKMDADPDTLKGKWQKAKRKFENADKSALVKGAAAVTTVVTAVVAVRTLSSKLAKSDKEYKDIQKNVRAQKDRIYAELNSHQNTDSPVTDKTGPWTTRLAIWRELQGISAAAATKNATALESIGNGIAKFLDAFSSDAATQRYHQRRQRYSDETALRDKQAKQGNNGGGNKS